MHRTQQVHANNANNALPLAACAVLWVCEYVLDTKSECTESKHWIKCMDELRARAMVEMGLDEKLSDISAGRLAGAGCWGRVLAGRTEPLT